MYTTPNGTDLLIEDRKTNIYSKYGNITMCQTGCEFNYYNTTTKKSVCDCNTKEITNDELSDVDFSPKKLAEGFTKTFSNSNFRVMKCYKLAFDTKNFFKNIGRIIMSLIFLLYLICIFLYIFIENKKIDKYINIIMQIKDKKLNINNNDQNKLDSKKYKSETFNKIEECKLNLKIKQKNPKEKKERKMVHLRKKRKINKT